MLKRFFLLGLLAQTSFVINAQEITTKTDTIELSPVVTMAKLPITSELISKRKIQSKNLGQDLPILLKNATSIIATSDAGSGIGYTSLRMRGIAQNQINVTFNGVPVNDSESHGVFWVDFPDLSSSTNNILIQRGVGTSSNGAAAFGGSINLETNKSGNKPFGEAMISAGSFNTKKLMLSAGTGNFANDKWNIDGRISKINSDGYIDRASSDLLSAALNVRYKPNKNNEFHVMNIFGHERTYQAWYGINKDAYEKNRTFNPSGAIYDSNGNVVDYYDNQVDNYDQNHLHAYWRKKWNNQWKSTTTAHYTRGLGYYEEYKQGAKLASYRINSNETHADLVRRQWLNNHFYGGIFNIEGRNIHDFNFDFGISANKYVGGHYGKVIDVINTNYSLNSDNYYENESNKVEFSSYAKALYKLGAFEIFGDIQLRTIDYKAEYKNNGKNKIKDFAPYDYSWTFVNPKAGVNYNIPNGRIYAAYGMTHREPTRSDILNNPDLVKPETLHDFELGLRVNSTVNFGVNLYSMYYIDQLVLTGKLDDVGNPIRENVGESYRNGIELDVSKNLFNNKLNLFGNLNWGENKNINFVQNTSNGLVKLGKTSIAYSPELVTSFGFNLYPNEAFSFNFTSKYVSEQYVTNTEVNDGILEKYFVSDLMGKYAFGIGNFKGEFSVLVNNIFDTQYANNGYYYSGTYYYPQAGRNYLAGLRIMF